MNWQLRMKGYLVIRLCGPNPERVINMAMSRGIGIWDIIQEKEGCLLFKIRLGGFKALRFLVRRTGCRMRIVRKRGLPFIIRRAGKRKVLVLGAVFFCLVLYVFNTFVWFVDVQGNFLIPSEVILQKVGENGLKVGARKGTLQKDLIVKQLLLEIPELSWATLHEQGTRITIEVAEKTPIPLNENSIPADLVARIAGRIEELLVLKGTPLVKEGDIVAPGQPLIAGYFYPHIQVNDDGSITPSGMPKRVRAQGLIRARVMHKTEARCLLKEEIVQDTGQETTAVILRWRDGEIILKGDSAPPFERYRQISRIRTVFEGRKLWGPVEVITITFREQTSQVIERGLEGAYQEAIMRARKEVEKELPADCRIISEKAEPLTPPKKE